MSKEKEVITYKIVDAKGEAIYEGDSRILAVKGYAQPHSMKWFEKTDKEPEYVIKCRRPEANENWSK